jgi:D-serine deaminase-like pyridoxal phosphate-dependent protein
MIDMHFNHTHHSSVDTLPTPALVIDGERVVHNIHRLADYGREHGIGIRPHTKTHKSIEIARRQLAAGAVGLTVAKVGEAEALLPAFEHQPADFLVAYPTVDFARASHVADLAQRCTIRVAIDTHAALAAVAGAASRAGSTVGVLVDLDVGPHRTGVATADSLVDLATAVTHAPGLRLDGIFFYPGHIWDAASDQNEPLRRVADALAEAVDRFDRHGLSREIVSGGSTPTAYQSHLIPQATEIRPGTNVFNDLNTLRGGYCSADDIAATILATVVSDAVGGQVVLDAGSKTLTSDRCVPSPDSGYGLLPDYPEAVIAKLTEEHAQVDITRCPKPPSVGERVTIIPNHICPCVNLQQVTWWKEGDGSLRPVVVDARGRLS